MNETSLPLDWEVFDSPFRGVSRNEKLRGYLAVLLLNGKQNHFGPFRMNRREAANAYDALTKYFISFVKAKPVPNCPAQAFLEIKDEETEEKYGKERLRKLKARLTVEANRAGIDLDIEASKRIDFIVGSCSLGSEKLISRRDRDRRKALIHLEARCMSALVDLNLVENLQNLAIPNHDMATHIAPELEATTQAFKAAQFALSKLIVKCKIALDLDPEASVK